MWTINFAFLSFHYLSTSFNPFQPNFFITDKSLSLVVIVIKFHITAKQINKKFNMKAIWKFWTSNAKT